MLSKLSVTAVISSTTTSFLMYIATPPPRVRLFLKTTPYSYKGGIFLVGLVFVTKDDF